MVLLNFTLYQVQSLMLLKKCHFGQGNSNPQKQIVCQNLITINK